MITFTAKLTIKTAMRVGVAATEKFMLGKKDTGKLKPIQIPIDIKKQRAI